MNDQSPPDAPREPDDLDGLGPDLLAHVRGELAPERAREIDARLQDDAPLRAEFDQLRADWETWTAAQSGRAPTPTRATLDALLDTVREEAAERRAAVAGALSPIAEDLGADVTALALGQLENGAERDRIQALVDADERLAAVHAAAGKLASATRDALTLVPHPETLPRLMARIAAENGAPSEFDTQDLPEPARTRPGRLHVLRWLAPLAAALAIVAVALYSPPDPAEGHRDAIVFWGDGIYEPESRQNGVESVDADVGAFRFDNDHILTAENGELSVRVMCGPGGAEPTATGPLPAGAAEFVLSEGTRLKRDDASHFVLLAGRLRVEARDLTDRLEIGSGSMYARVTGTRFEAVAVDGRLFVIVEEGAVELGVTGDAAQSIQVRAGEQGMAATDRVVSAPLDGRGNGDAFLTPRALLEGPTGPVTPDGALDFVATLAAGDGGAVTIQGFDASEPRFFIRLKGPRDHSLPVKIQESMLTEAAPTIASTDGSGSAGWKLDADRPYVLRIRLDGLDLEPGTWEARLRYVSFRGSAPGSEWLGAIESAPVLLEVRSP